MEEEKDPESSAKDLPIDPDEEARRIILARRARFVAVALVSAGVGTAACGGQTGDSTPRPCLSLAATGGTGSTPQVCLGVSNTGGAVPCLSIAMGGAYWGTGGTAGAYGSGGIPQPCLSPPPPGTGGTPQPCLDIAPPDAGPTDAAADAPRDAAPVPCLSVDAAPVPCLSIPQVPNSGNSGS